MLHQVDTFFHYNFFIDEENNMNNQIDFKIISILYVEDDDIIRIEFAEILNRIFGKVIVARNGDEALFLYNELCDDSSKIDVIISDIDMPVMNGLDLLAEVRKFDEKVPFIFTTAHSDSDFLLKSIHLNVSEYLIKPIKVDALKSKIQTLFGKIIKERQKSYEYNELAEHIDVVNQVALVSKTNQAGIITHANNRFCDISGYTQEELIGSNHNIIRHSDNSKIYYQQMWNELKKGNIWKGKIKNRAKNGEAYFLNSTIIPIFDEDDKCINEYISVNFVTTKIELKNREFKKNVRYTFREVRKTNYFANNKIIELEKKMKSFQHINLIKESLESERLKSGRLLSQVSYLEKDISNAELKINKIAHEANIKVSKATFLLKSEKTANKQRTLKFETMQKKINDQNNEISKLAEQVRSKNKTILNLKDVIAHREDQLKKSNTTAM